VSRSENAISGVVNDLRGGLVTKWFAVYEFVDESGDRDLATMSTDGLMRWDVQGMLDYVMDGNKAARFAAYLEGDKGSGMTNAAQIGDSGSMGSTRVPTFQQRLNHAYALTQANNGPAREEAKALALVLQADAANRQAEALTSVLSALAGIRSDLRLARTGL
jgi:hypothetical protein